MKLEIPQEVIDVLSEITILKNGEIAFPYMSRRYERKGLIFCAGTLFELTDYALAIKAQLSSAPIGGMIEKEKKTT